MAAPVSSAASARPDSPEQLCGFDCLDDFLLGLILGSLPARRHGAAASLVCKRWRRVYFETPAAWRSLWLGPGALVNRRSSFSDWLAGKHRLLQLVGQHITAVSLDDTWGALSGAASTALFTWHIGRMLNSRQLPALRQLTLFLDQPALVESKVACRALGSLSGLSRLSITADWLPALTAVALSSLTALRDLYCRARYLPEGLPSAISRLPITDLHLESHWAVLPTQPLYSLSQLHSLTLRCESASLQLPHPGRFPMMRRFMAEGGSFFNASSKLTVAGARMARVSSTCQGKASGPGSKQLPAAIEVTRLQSLRSLPRLLQALLPRKAQLTCLTIDNWDMYSFSQGPTLPLRPDTVAGCSQLASLEELELTDQAFGSDADAAVSALLQQAPRLRRLTLWAVGETDAATCLASLPASVTALCIGGASLAGIPDNRLSGLRSLRIGHLDDNFSRDTWPQCLASATAVTHLKLADVTLVCADAEAIAQSMRQLRQLSIKCVSMEALELLQEAMPGLEVSAKVVRGLEEASASECEDFSDEEAPVPASRRLVQLAITAFAKPCSLAPSIRAGQTAVAPAAPVPAKELIQKSIDKYLRKQGS